MCMKTGQWVCERCEVHKAGLENDLKFLPKDLMLGLDSVPVRVIKKEEGPPVYHEQFPEEEWRHSGFLDACEWANFSSSWLSLPHISTFLKDLCSDPKKFLGRKSDVNEWRLRIGSISQYYSITRTGCSEGMFLKFPGLEKKHYRSGFARLALRSSDPKSIHALVVKLSEAMIKAFTPTDEKDGARFLHSNLHDMAQYGWRYTDAKLALQNLEKTISLNVEPPRVRAQKRRAEGIPAVDVTSDIFKSVKELNCYTRANIHKLQHQQIVGQKSLADLHRKCDTIIALLGQRPNVPVAAAAQVIQYNDKPPSVQGAAGSGEIEAEAPRIQRAPSAFSASSDFENVSDEETDMEVDVLGRAVRDNGIEQPHFDALDGLPQAELENPVAQIDQRLHQQADEAAEMYDNWASQGGEL